MVVGLSDKCETCLHKGTMVGVTKEGFRALQIWVQELKEKECRGMNISIRDKSKEEFEEGQVERVAKKSS